MYGNLVPRFLFFFLLFFLLLFGFGPEKKYWNFTFRRYPTLLFYFKKYNSEEAIDINLVPCFLFFFPLFFLRLLGFLRICPDLFLCCRPRNLGATLINLVPLFCLSRDSNPVGWNSCPCWEINHKLHQQTEPTGICKPHFPLWLSKVWPISR